MKKTLIILLLIPVMVLGQMSSARKMLLAQGSTMSFVMSMSTTSTNAAWSPSNVFKSGATLHWEVTGAVTTSADSNDPTFNFSAAGTKNITVTSTDGGSGLSALDVGTLSLTALNISGAPELVALTCSNNYLYSLSIANNVNLATFACDYNWLSSLDISPAIGLFILLCNNNNLTKSAVDTILDELIANNKPNGELYCQSQSPAITPDAAKISALQALSWAITY